MDREGKGRERAWRIRGRMEGKKKKLDRRKGREGKEDRGKEANGTNGR